MARLEEIPLSERKMMETLDCSGFEGRRPWVKGPPLNKRRVALVSTAALSLRNDKVYQRDETAFRIIPSNVNAGDVVMSHSSVNFDRTGFQQDLNVCFPLQRIHDLAAEGVIGSVANFHFTVSGAPHPVDLEPSARAIARAMQSDGVDTVLLVPI
ncbi:MAG: glycine/sarcosine/betaine reductase selenoprotein B family protein [Burkholderiales bacterium]